MLPKTPTKKGKRKKKKKNQPGTLKNQGGACDQKLHEKKIERQHSSRTVSLIRNQRSGRTPSTGMPQRGDEGKENNSYKGL